MTTEEILKQERDQVRSEVERLQTTLADIQANPPPSREQWHAVCYERDFLKAWAGGQLAMSDLQSADEMRAALDAARAEAKENLEALQQTKTDWDEALRWKEELDYARGELAGIDDILHDINPDADSDHSGSVEERAKALLEIYRKLSEECNFLREARLETERQLAGLTKERNEAEEDSRRFAEQNAALRAALVECRARLEFLSFLGENDVLERADKALGLSQP